MNSESREELRGVDAVSPDLADTSPGETSRSGSSASTGTASGVGRPALSSMDG
ncbi:MAG: hypothetical protein GIX03_04980 [Candidatus Eremiobacteraeota bacterium]|nr:hypothetical protein [Candidatus Eremiobacteraeota bacterium]MBC5802350.1 hypothetical protein [Candidatus Eremiobacteraeota bacterium]MBC5822732.1 hypothetical protein [Candidatus Eremiobacteraeota bacterium]